MPLVPMQFDPPPMMISPTPTISVRIHADDGRIGGDMLPVPTGFDPAVHPGGGEMPLVPMLFDPTDEKPPMMGAPAIPLLGVFLDRRHRPRAVKRPVPRDGRDVEILRQQFQEMGLRRRRKRSCFSHEEEEEGGGLMRFKKGRAELVEEALILADEEELPTSFTMLEISAGGGSSSPALSALEELVAGMLAGTTITQKSPTAPANRGELSVVDADEPIMLYEFAGLNIVEEEGTLKDWDVVVPGRDDQQDAAAVATPAAASQPDVWDGYECINWAAALFDHPDAW